jgi:hypothetical protein
MSRNPTRYSASSPTSVIALPTDAASAPGRSGRGRNRRDGRIDTRKTTAQANASSPTTASAHRQFATSSTRPATSRPAIPPMLLPAMYSPMPLPRESRCSSSAR